MSTPKNGCKPYPLSTTSASLPFNFTCLLSTESKPDALVSLQNGVCTLLLTCLHIVHKEELAQSSEIEDARRRVRSGALQFAHRRVVACPGLTNCKSHLLKPIGSKKHHVPFFLSIWGWDEHCGCSKCTFFNGKACIFLQCPLSCLSESRKQVAKCMTLFIIKRYLVDLVDKNLGTEISEHGEGLGFKV